MRLSFAIAFLFASHMAFAVSGVLQGSETVVYDGANLKTDLQDGCLVATNEAWRGVLCVTNASFKGLPPELVANSNSVFRLIGCKGYFDKGECPGTVELKDVDGALAFIVDNGAGDVESRFAKLSGDGTLACTKRNIFQRYVFNDASAFKGSILTPRLDDTTQKHLRVIIGNGSYETPDDGTITLLSSSEAVISDGKIWSASTNHIYGTLSFVGGGSLQGDTVAYSGSILSLANSTSAQAIVGRLTLKGGASICLPAYAKFPYKVASSIATEGDVSLYIGTEECAGEWIIDDGSICPIAARSVTLPSNAVSVNWGDIEWHGAEAHTNDVAFVGVITVQESIQLCLGNATARKVAFNVAEGKTLSLVGHLTADEVEINGRGTVSCNMQDVLTAAITGGGTLCYEGVVPTFGEGYVVATNASWSGTLWLNGAQLANPQPLLTLSANSTLRLTGCKGCFDKGECSGTVELKDVDGALAFVVDNWAGDVESRFAKLSGDGTLACTKRNIFQRYVFNDASAFKGSILTPRLDDTTQKHLRVIIGNGSYETPDYGTITLLSSSEAVISDGKIWSASTNHIYGTLSFVGGGSLHGDTVACAGSILSFTNSTSVQPIVGRLSLKGGSSIHLPASAKFPYKVATSIVKDGEVSLYVGTEEITEGWFAFDGAICPIFLKSSSVNTNHDSWSNLAWRMSGSYTNETALATAICASSNSVVIVDQDATVDLGSVTTRKVTFDVAEGKTLSLVGSLTADEVAINGRGVVACDANDVMTATLTGGGTLCYESNAPTFGEGYIVATNDAWSGTLWLKGVEFANLEPHLILSTNSTLRLTGCRGCFGKGTWLGSLELIDGESGQAAFTVTSGFSSATSAIERLAGGGTLYVMADVANQTYAFTDSSDFSGAIHIEPSKSMHFRVNLRDRVYGIDGDAGHLSLATFKTEAQLKAEGLDFGDGVSVSEALSQKCENGLYAWQNMILGINPNECENVKPYVAPVQNSTPGKLSFRIGNCRETDIFNDMAAKYFVYEVYSDGSPVEGSGALNSGEPALIGDEVSIDLSGLTSVRYFRIKIVFQ